MRQTIPISKDFFCDGHCYLLTSSSFGGSGLTAEEVQEILFRDDKNETRGLLEKGVCFPVCFPGDCALDGATVFVLGELTEAEQREWMARLRWKLNVPCGKLILCCGCLAEDLEPAIAGEAPDPHFTIYQVIDVPPGEYLVEIYAFSLSQTVRVELGTDDDEEGLNESETDGEIADYIIRLTPLDGEPPLPEMESGWLEKFEFRSS